MLKEKEIVRMPVKKSEPALFQCVFHKAYHILGAGFAKSDFR
jgi:hypothetical protein